MPVTSALKYEDGSSAGELSSRPQLRTRTAQPALPVESATEEPADDEDDEDVIVWTLAYPGKLQYRRSRREPHAAPSDDVGVEGAALHVHKRQRVAEATTTAAAHRQESLESV